MSNKPSSSEIVRVMHKGWLWKHGGRVRNWKRRFFVLTTAGRLTYYSSESDAEQGNGALGIIDVHKALYVTRRVKDEEPGAWPEPVPVDVCFTIITNDRNYGVYSEAERDTAAWVKQLQTVRGGSDTSDIMVEQEQPQQRRSSMSTHMNNFCMRYKILDLSPKVQMMWMKWSNVGQRALKALADHFGIVEEITLACDAGDMYKRLPTNRRTRVGEYVFADYMDELRFNLCAEFGDEDVAKAAFRAAFSKRKVRIEMRDGDAAAAPNTVRLADGALVLTVQAARFGAGIHLAGKGLSRDVCIADGDAATLSGSSVAGMTVCEFADIARHTAAVGKACDELQARLPGNPAVTFRCDYRAIAAQVKEHGGGAAGDVASRLGSVVLRPIVCKLLADLAAFVGRASGEAAERIAGESGSLGIVFRLGDPAAAGDGDDGGGCDPSLDVNADGDVVVTSSVSKLVEMATYERPPVFNLDKLFA